MKKGSKLIFLSLISTLQASTFTFFDDNQKLSFYPETSNDASSPNAAALDLQFEFFVDSLDGELVSMDSRERDLEWDIVVDVSRANVTISFNAYDSASNQNLDDKVVLPASPLEAYKWYQMSLTIEDGHLSASLEIEGRKLQTKKDLKIFENVDSLKSADRIEFGRDLIGCLGGVRHQSQEITSDSTGGALVKRPSEILDGCYFEDECFKYDPSSQRFNPSCLHSGICTTSNLTSPTTLYKCDCPSPFVGQNCANELSTADFIDDELSFIIHLVQLESNKIDFETRFKTNQETSFLAFLGDTSLRSDEFFLVQIIEGRLVIQLTSEILHRSDTQVSDDLWHDLKISLLPDSLQIELDKTVTETLALERDVNVTSEFAYIGGLPDIITKVLAAGNGPDSGIENNNAKLLDSTFFFHGEIQDVRLNKKFLLFEDSDDEKFEGDMHLENGWKIVLPKEKSAVKNEKKEEVCECKNGGSCIEDGGCECPSGTEGFFCEVFTNCIDNLCPNPTLCRPLATGYICDHPITLGADDDLCANQRLRLLTSPPAEPLSSISLSVRTRSSSTTFLSINDAVELSVTSDGLVNVTLAPDILKMPRAVSTIISGASISDGLFHDINLELLPQKIILSINGHVDDLVEVQLTQKQWPLKLLFKEGENLMKLGSEAFEGCVKDLKLGTAPIGLGLQPGIDPGNAPSDDLVFFPTDDDFCISTECAFDSCIDSTCNSNGACISDSEVHLCICNEEFVGDYCNITAACQDVDCGDFGYCIGMNNGTCICDEGFEGENCEVNIDDCEESSCSRFSTCIDGINSYECSCDSGFFGPHCTITKNSTCADSPCLDEEQCVPVDIKSMEFNFKCVKKGPDCVEPCPEGLVCRQDQCVPIDFCEFVDECQKNSYCWVKNNTASCVCLPGWEGESCEIDFDECAVHSSHGEPVCSEFGTCINMPGTYRCECMDGITGPFCTIDVDECIENPCKNNGRCENEFGGYKCYCYREFYGENCEFACRPGTCQNDGVCLTEDLENGNQGWSCNCPEHIYGEKCEHISPCYSVPCGAENECVVNVTEIASGKNKNKFECECSEGLTGKLCNFEDRCFTDDPCLNGPCTPEDDKFFCDCTDTGFSGQTCGEDIDECSLEIDPCGDHGSCFNTPGSFTCECDDGYSGILCEIKDLCFEVSCSDQGKCDPSTGFCNCNPGFLPPDCSEIDTCFEVTCLNNGTCAEGLCACDDRWVGQNCEFENLCEDDLCGNGRCKVDQMSGEAECECNFGYVGKQCIQEVTCEFLECPSSQTCTDESPPKCIEKTPQNPKDKKDQRTNEKLGGSVIETQGTLESGLTHTPSTVALPWIIVISVIGSIIVIGLITFLAVLRSKRRATGTYSPTRHEKQPEVIKQTMWKSLESPEPERLI